MNKLSPLGFILLFASSLTLAEPRFEDLVFKAGHTSLQGFLLPDTPPAPTGNRLTPERIELGKKLFFDPRLSLDGNMSCATCHNPMFGWSDGLPTGRGFKSQVLGRASPTIVNTAFNSIQMWDGRKKDLEDQAMGPMMSNAEMNMDIPQLINFLQTNSGYQQDFAEAYPNEEIDETTLAKALASFERTVISNNSPFDHWVRGDKKALNKQEILGFKVFMDPDKGNCAVCHSGPNFTDNGFHNIGLPSFGKENPDPGRFSEKPIGLMMGAFKTPTVRDIELTAPYFHDGSAETLEEVVEHYAKGGVVKTNLSPNLKELDLNKKEKAALVAFMRALTTPPENFKLPVLPL